MAFGILEDRHLARPTGTTVLEDRSKATESGISADTSHLKKDGDIVLVPQPSDDPNDPLNWSKYQKCTIIIMISIMSTTTAAMAAMLTPAIPIIAQQFAISTDTVNTWTIGLLTFWTGFGAFFTAAGANVVGKRPFILASLLVMFITNSWGAFTTNFNSLAALRTIQGIASAPYDTMVTSTISDLFFLHQRGTWLALWGLVISTGILAGQVISGLIIESVGYNATFAISASVFGLLMIAGFFTYVETTYTKKRPLPSPPNSEEEDLDDILELKKAALLPKEPYSQQLRIVRGRVSDANFFKEMLKPFPLMLSPAVAYGSIVNGVSFAFLIGVSILATIILAAPPYNLGPSQLGFINIPPFFATLIASPISGWMADAVARWMARRNQGIFEPEYRLTLTIVGIPLMTATYIGLGEAIARQQSLPIVLFWLSMQSFATPFLVQAALSYVLDNHAENANLAFVAVSFFRALFTFLSTSFLAGLLETLGPRTLFLGIAAVNFGVLMLTVPLYIFGKRLRSALDRSAIGRRIILDTPTSST